MYIVCTKSVTTFDAPGAIRYAVAFGSLSSPSQSWEVYATFIDRGRAFAYAQTLANELDFKVEVRSAYGAGDHYSIGVFDPTPTPEETTTPEEQEKDDGVPADTGSV